MDDVNGAVNEIRPRAVSALGLLYSRLFYALMLSGERAGEVGAVVATVECAAAGAVVEVVNLADLWP